MDEDAGGLELSGHAFEAMAHHAPVSTIQMLIIHPFGLKLCEAWPRGSFGCPFHRLSRGCTVDVGWPRGRGVRLRGGSNVAITVFLA